jgi:hypothetical protein
MNVLVKICRPIAIISLILFAISFFNHNDLLNFNSGIMLLISASILAGENLAKRKTLLKKMNDFFTLICMLTIVSLALYLAVKNNILFIITMAFVFIGLSTSVARKFED